MGKSKGHKKEDAFALAFAAAAMFCLVAALLLAAFWTAVYGDPNGRFYEREYKKYGVTKSLRMDLDDVMDVTEYMMDYLIGKEETLSFETVVDGTYQDFFNGQDRLHMADVRNLFLGGLRLMRILLVVFLAIVLVLRLKKKAEVPVFCKAYGIAMGISILAAVFLGVAFSVDFTKCFTIFHHLFFTNDLWLFDPAEDYMIRMLPEGFFFDMVVRIAVVFAAFLLLAGVGLFLLRAWVSRQKHP